MGPVEDRLEQPPSFAAVRRDFVGLVQILYNDCWLIHEGYNMGIYLSYGVQGSD